MKTNGICLKNCSEHYAISFRPKPDLKSSIINVMRSQDIYDAGLVLCGFTLDWQILRYPEDEMHSQDGREKLHQCQVHWCPDPRSFGAQ